MNSLLPWICGSTLGGGGAAVGTFLLSWLVFHLFRPSGTVDTPFELAPVASVFLLYCLAGCLHGGFIGSLQGLFLLKKIPQNKQALYTGFKGSLAGLTLFGVLANFVLFSLVNIPIFAYFDDSNNMFMVSLFFLSTTVSSLIQGLIQHRIARRRSSELFRWCFYSIFSGNLGLVFFYFSLLFFVRFVID